MLSLIPVLGLPLIQAGDRLSDLILSALSQAGETPQPGDILVVAQKVVSKAEGRTVNLADVFPSDRANQLALESGKDPRLVELILLESTDVVRVRPGLIVVEDRRGLICANAGIDRSNIEQTASGETVALLPIDPDRSARELRDDFFALSDCQVGVIINDSHGRAFREGTVGIAVGVAGIPALSDRRGDEDLTGYTLQHTVIGIADELAAAASLLMGPAAEGVPVVIVRGLNLPTVNGCATDIQRPRETDLFR